MRSSILVWVFTFAIATAQETATGEFTKSPTEHIINKIDEPFVVRSVKGIISRQTGATPEPLPNVLFEIKGPETDQRIRRARTNENGRFKIGHVPDGRYQFKATLNGFQSVMGTITVSGKAAKTGEIKIAMPMGV